MWTRVAAIRFIRRSLTAKILCAFALVVLVGIGGVAFLANERTTDAFEHYLRGGQPGVETRLATLAAIAYRQDHSWTMVSQILTTMPGPPDQRVVIVDPSGKVVVDTDNSWVGQAAAGLPLLRGSPIAVNGQDVGTLHLVAPPYPLLHGRSLDQTGVVHRFDPMPSPDRTLSGLSPAGRAFLAQVNQSIFFAAVGAILAALILGILLARQIIQPLRRLTRAAQRIAHGHLDERIAVAGEDEVGQLADAFNQMAASLERTEKARRQLVADVAHELRTPLTVIGGTVQAMQDGVLPQDDSNLESIQDEVAALARLVADLRDLSLGDVGQFLIERAPVDPAAVIESAAAPFATAAAAREIDLQIDIASDLPSVLGDAARLRQCVRNLVDNALRYTPSGGRVTVRGRSAGGAVIIEVADTGDGIDSDHLARVFERFFRGDPSRARRSGGTGLGLAIVQQIVQAHGGEIRAASPGPGRGATFTMRLPAASTPATSKLASA